MREQHRDGHFQFDLEADAAIPAEAILVKHFLGEPDLEMERKTAAYLRRLQEPHGGWPMLAKGEVNISASVKAYFALKIAGDSTDAPHMVRAREAILKAGGAVNVNVFTKTFLALFGIVPLAAPCLSCRSRSCMRRAGFPSHLYKISYWARATLVPLLVVMALKPRARNPRSVTIDELFLVAAAGRAPLAENRESDRDSGGLGFAALDKVLHRRRAVLFRHGHARHGHREGDGVRSPPPQRRGRVRRNLSVDRLHLDDVQGHGRPRGSSGHDRGARGVRQADGRQRRGGLLPAMPVADLGHGAVRRTP